MISVVDVLARQVQVLAEQAKAVRASTLAQLDAIDRQVECLLETVRVLQQPPAPTPVARAAPKSPPVFGAKPMTRDDVLHVAGAAASSDGDPVGTLSTRDTSGDS